MILNHFGSIRLRVTGSGNLKLTLFSYSEEYSDPQAPIAMSLVTSTPPTALANFTQMKAKLRIQTTEIDETFNISQIILYIKPSGTNFPQ